MLTKFLFTVAVVVGVWAFFRMLARRGQGQTPSRNAAKAAEDAVRARMAKRGTAASPRDDADAPVEDLARCPSCGVFVVPGTTCQCGYPVPSNKG